MAILVTGGAGYIGSHICVELLQNGYDVIVIDNLSNSKSEVFNRIRKITKRNVKFYKMDLLDKNSLEAVFQSELITTVIHLAGWKAVGESVREPLKYYQNNIMGTLTLCEVMARFGVKNLIFSSSATVYGNSACIPFTEECPVGQPTSPYSWSKVMQEQMLTDLYKADDQWNIVILRYFNPVSAHESGLLGEDPCGIPNNLFPNIAQVAIGRKKHLDIYGNDYPTPDGTAIRDYIHVVDLAKGHRKALKLMVSDSGIHVYNLGTGIGYSVLEVLHAYEQACGKALSYVMKSRRAGDIAAYYCQPAKARQELDWEAEYGIEAMCRDSWRWQRMNPRGYDE